MMVNPFISIREDLCRVTYSYTIRDTVYDRKIDGWRRSIIIFYQHTTCQVVKRIRNFISNLSSHLLFLQLPSSLSILSAKAGGTVLPYLYGYKCQSIHIRFFMCKLNIQLNMQSKVNSD